MGKVKAIPDGYHSVTPYLSVAKDCAGFIDFVKRAFGAEEVNRMAGPGGMIMHAEIRIGDSIVMVSDSMGQPAQRTGLMLYVQDCDAVFKRAVDAGAKVEMAVADQFWGDRYGRLTDPWGNSWSVGTHIEDVPPAEMQRRAAEWMAKMGGGKT